MKPAKRADEVDTWRPPAMRDRTPPKASGTYTTTPYTVDVDELPYEEDELTPVRMACLVCKGHAFIVKEHGTGYSKSRCDWCTGGSMSSDQINRYLNRDRIKANEIESMLRRYVQE